MEIRLYVAHHFNTLKTDAKTLIPINVNMDSGENISSLSNYSELRVLYWVWKNEKVLPGDLLGFFQYRRYLDLRAEKVITAPGRYKPYSIVKFPNGDAYSREKLLKIVSDYDVITPIPENTGETVWKRYEKKHRLRDLELVYQIIEENYAEYLPYADQYLMGTQEYYCNMYLMSGQVLDQYCQWIFEILFEYDRRIIDPPSRVNGYLSERLFGIWFTWASAQPELRCAYAPRVHFYGFDDSIHRLKRERFINLLLPPGSKRRIWLKRGLGQ